MENKEIKLKDFIYLDTSHITSMLAQINRGSILNITDIKDKSKSTTDELTESEGGATMGLNFGLNIQRHIENDKVITTNYLGETEQQLINKALDDYSYNLLVEYLNNNKLMSEPNVSEGKYVSIGGKFNLFDFNYLMNVIDSIQSVSENPYIKDENMSKTNLENVTQIFQAAKDVLSADHFIFIDNYVIIPNDNYFRYKGLQFILRYNTRVKVLAKVIKKVNAKESDNKGMKALMNFADVLVPIIKEDILELPKRNEFYYVLPIAIY